MLSALPDPSEVRDALTRISEEVQRFDQHMGKLAESYGVRGEPMHFNEGTFTLTRSGKTWGIFFTEPHGNTQHCSGAPVGAKMKLLSYREEFEEQYRKSILDIYNAVKRLR